MFLRLDRWSASCGGRFDALAEEDDVTARRMPVDIAAAAPALGEIQASAAALQAAHVGPGYWHRTNRAPPDPQNWYHIRWTFWTSTGNRVTNYWKHRGGPRRTTHERNNTCTLEPHWI